MERCNCWVAVSNSDKAVCYGTKEREECDCNGDISKCNFYPEKRKEKKMNTIEMMNQAYKDGRTYIAKNMRFNATLGFHDSKGVKWPGYAFTLINDIFDIDSWRLKPDNEMTREEAEAKFNIKIVGD